MSLYNQIAGRRVSRIEAISDGVFAVAFTLLVLDIKVPVVDHIHNEHDLMAAFFTLTPKLLSYFLSFMTLGIFWAGQAAQFTFIEKSNRHLNWISLFFLMFVSILPFTTAFLSEYIDFKFAIFIYWLNIFLLGLIIYINWYYAYTQDFLSVTGEEKIQINKAVRKRIISAQSLYFLGMLLCFINTYLSIAFIILVQLNYALALFSKTKQVR
ncbi:MAG: TMEM175 family protein [Saprospiraceae bacterium]